MKKDCSTCLCREGSCYPSITIFDKDKICRSYTPDYEGYIAELEKKNNELKTVKIPQLERKIASIRGAHSVDCRKLNARREQVERLKKENAELKVDNAVYEKACEGASMMYEHLNKAKEIIKSFSEFVNNEVEYDSEHPQEHTDLWNELCEQVEQFLKDVE